MAEIKKFETGGFYNKPIGVVRPSDAGVRFAQQVERAGATLANFAYERAVEEQTEAGKKAALRMRTRDENGKLIYQDVSDELSPVAQKQAESVYNQAYLTSLGNDMKNQMQALYDQHQLDPDGFDAQADILREKTKELVPEDFQVFADEIGMSLQSEYYNTAATNAKKAFNEQVANNAIMGFEGAADDNYQISINDTLTLLDSGRENWGGIAARVKEVSDNYDEALRIFMQTNPTQQAISKFEGMMNRNEMNVAAGAFQAMLQYFDKIPVTDASHATQSQLKVDLANALTTVAKTGAIPQDINPIARQLLQEVGAEQIVQGMRRESRNNLASDLATSANQLEERISDEVARARVETTGINITTATMKDKADWMVANGLDTPMSVITHINNNKGNNADPVNRLLFGSTADLPSQVTDIFNNETTLLSMATRDYAGLRSLYNQITMPNVAGAKVFMPRGLNDKAVQLMTTLQTIEKFQIPGGVNGYLAKVSDPMFDAEAVGKQILGNKKVSDIVNKHIDDDSPTLRVQANEILPHLVGHLGFDGAIETLKRMDEKHVSSDLLYDNERSMMTPEAVYGEDLDTWIELANTKIRTSGDYTIGDNAKLVRRKNTVSPEWLVIDTNTGFPIHFQGREIVLNDKALNAQRAADAEVNAMLARKRALAMQEKARQDRLQSIKDAEFAEGIGDVSVGEDSTFLPDLLKELGFGQPVTQSIPSETE